MASPYGILVSQIQLILSQEDSPLLYVVRNPKAVLFGGGGVRILDPGDSEVSSERVTTLRLLYARQSGEAANTFPGLLLAEVSRAAAAIIVTTLVEIGHVSGIISYFSANWPPPLDDALIDRGSFWAGVAAALTHQAHRFIDEDLKKLRAASERDATWANDNRPVVAPDRQLCQSTTVASSLLRCLR